MLRFSGNSRLFPSQLFKAQWLVFLFMLACGTQSQKTADAVAAQGETCGSKLSPSQKINIDYAVQQDYADDGIVNGSWNPNGRQPDGVMVHNAKASAIEDYADDGKVNGSTATKSLQSDRDDLTADAKDGKIDGIYCK